MKKEFSAGIIIYVTELIDDVPTRLYLLLQYQRGYWDLVKGKLEPGETNEEAALRELKEETGLEATIDAGFQKALYYKFTDPDGVLIDKKVTYFTGEATSQEVTLSHEHKGYCWLPYDKAFKELTYLNARNLLIEAEQFLNTKK